jgi:hypothetical protein
LTRCNKVALVGITRVVSIIIIIIVVSIFVISLILIGAVLRVVVIISALVDATVAARVRIHYDARVFDVRRSVYNSIYYLLLR